LFSLFPRSFLLAACGAVVGILGLVSTSRWALNTATRTAASYAATEPKTPVMTG